jgi:hypothetical protein
MLEDCDGRLKVVNNQLVELIAQLDLAINDARESAGNGAARDADANEPEWVRQLIKQREVLMTVAASIADMEFGSARR